MITLESMNQSDYETYKKSFYTDYVVDQVVNDRLKIDAAFEKVVQELGGLLSNGLETPNEYISNLMLGEKKIGVLWLHFDPKNVNLSIFDILIDKEFQDKAYLQQLLCVLAIKANQLGAKSINLKIVGSERRAKYICKKISLLINDADMESLKKSVMYKKLL